MMGTNVESAEDGIHATFRTRHGFLYGDIRAVGLPAGSAW